MAANIPELVKKARVKFFTQELIFFGMIGAKFDWDVYDFDKDKMGFVQFNKDDLSKLEAGKVHLNRYWLGRPDYEYTNLVHLVVHELLHILNKHGIRMGDRDMRLWNVACDHVIERFIRDIKSVKPYQGRYNILPRLHQDLPNCSAEQAYEWLMKNSKVYTIKDGPGGNTWQVFDQNGNMVAEVSKNVGGVDEQETKGSDPKVQQQMEQLIAESRAIYQNMKEKGSLPGNLTSYFDEILKVEIPWERLLEKAIKTSTIMLPDERSWRVLNKYFIPSGLTLPGYAMTEISDGVGILHIGVDTSGSIGDTELKKFSSVIEQSMKNFKTVRVVTHDVEVHQVRDFNKDDINEFYTFLKKEGYKGRGGTSHKYLFDKIAEDWEEDKDEMSMVISLTDGYSDIESIYRSYAWIKNNLPLVFILIPNSHQIGLDEKFGVTTQIQINN